MRARLATLVLVCAVAAAAGGSAGAQLRQADAGREQGAAHDASLAGAGNAAALERLKNGAEGGDAYAQFALAILYLEGRGVPRNNDQYLYWLRKSGELGYARAQMRLSAMYEEGIGVPRDPVQAAGWAQRAAEQENAGGLATLVTDYYYGRGVAQSDVEAIKWHAIAVADGYDDDTSEFAREIRQRAGPIRTAEGEALAREWLAAHAAGAARVAR